MIGFCFYRLGMHRDAERQLQSSFKDQPMVLTCLLLAKVLRCRPGQAQAQLLVGHGGTHARPFATRCTFEWTSRSAPSKRTKRA